ncbi:hypothetical protein ACH4T9_09600 [Micromonospora sp. NPDC020750]|uniref:hypothetical protein n=1 Tax=unclassified Micromonospora TaxID=2617518 RepID=UPI0037B8BCDE
MYRPLPIRSQIELVPYVPVTVVPLVWHWIVTFVLSATVPTEPCPVPGPERTVNGVPAVSTVPEPAPEEQLLLLVQVFVP